MILLVKLGAIFALAKEYFASPRVYPRILSYIVHFAPKNGPTIVFLVVLFDFSSCIADCVRIFNQFLPLLCLFQELVLGATITYGDLRSRQITQFGFKTACGENCGVVLVLGGLGELIYVEGDYLVHLSQTTVLFNLEHLYQLSFSINIHLYLVVILLLCFLAVCNGLLYFCAICHIGTLNGHL